MAYIQKNNPIPRTGCGRRRAEQMANPFKKISKRSLSKVSTQLKKASKIDKAIDSPLKKGISGPCKAAAKRKFKVWPSAYASGWGVRCTKAGGPSKYGGSK